MEQMFMEKCSSQDNMPSHKQQRIISIETPKSKKRKAKTQKDGQNLFTSRKLM